MSPHLKLQFAVAGGVDTGKGRTCGGERLRIRHAARRPENAEKLVALAPNTAKQGEFLKDHPPGDDREEKKQPQNSAGNETRLFKNGAKIGGEGCDQEKRNVCPSVEKICWTLAT